ncbi:hypothetical protein GYMLUDRAFT_550377 [Collybiopsis luxurians FD-317 M1]|nr:hypothetical protein GYMLUDRAFT_550377 [Collybiopsis luxurians FD-317 M1]
MASEISPSALAQITCTKIIGYMFTWILYGFLCSHTWVYYQSFPKDPVRTKVLVCYLFIIGTAQSVMQIHDALLTFGLNFGNTSMVENDNLGWFSGSIIAGMASLPVQLFYARRMTIFSHTTYTKLIAITVVILAFFATITATIGGVKVFQGQGASDGGYANSLSYNGCSP